MSADETELIRAILDNVDQGVNVKNYAVVSVAAGAARDGSDQVEITVGPTAIAAPYLASYASPTVGDVVAVLTVYGSPLILGRVIGLPTI